jgi:Protein of unknown function (DUF2752)
MIRSNLTTYRNNTGPSDFLRVMVIIALAVITSSGVFFYLFEIDFIDFLPTVSICPFHAVTGFPCPGCGMTRAMISIGQLNFKQAVEYNLFSMALLILMIIYVGPGKFPRFLQNKVLSILMLLLVIFIWLIRLTGLQVV